MARKNSKVLVIDADKAFAGKMAEILTPKCFNTILSYSGNDGIQKTSHTSPDIVLLNHQLPDLESKEVMITSQNHGFAVDEESLPANLKATHRSLFDGSLQGVMRTDTPAFSFQGHPEASPGPHDVAPLFDRFIQLIEINAKDAKAQRTQS